MKSNHQLHSLLMAIVIAPLAIFGNTAFAQQHIAEELLEQQIKHEESKARDEPERAQASKENKPAKESSYEIDPRLTPEYWGIEEDTIF